MTLDDDFIARSVPCLIRNLDLTTTNSSITKANNLYRNEFATRFRDDKGKLVSHRGIGMHFSMPSYW